MNMVRQNERQETALSQDNKCDRDALLNGLEGKTVTLVKEEEGVGGPTLASPSDFGIKPRRNA